MSAPLRAVAILAPLFLGALAGYSLRDREEELNQANGQTADSLLNDIRKEGHRIVTDESIPGETVDLGSHIKNLYRGLYMLGRTRVLLPGDVQESVATKLKHFHHLYNADRDQELIAWYETIGVSCNHDLADLLAKCPEANRFDTRYIAYAMGVKAEHLKFPTLKKEAVKHFWA